MQMISAKGWECCEIWTKWHLWLMNHRINNNALVYDKIWKEVVNSAVNAQVWLILPPVIPNKRHNPSIKKHTMCDQSTIETFKTWMEKSLSVSIDSFM